MSLLAKIVIGGSLAILAAATVLAAAVGAGAGFAEAFFREVKNGTKKW